MKAIKSVDVGSFALYGAVLVAFWTFAFGLWYWILGWIFGAQSWLIDMNLANWSAYTFATFMSVFWRSFGQRHPAARWAACLSRSYTTLWRA